MLARRNAAATGTTNGSAGGVDSGQEESGIGWMRIVVSWPGRATAHREPRYDRRLGERPSMRREAGMTLVEVMISAVVLSMVMLALSAP